LRGAVLVDIAMNCFPLFRCDTAFLGIPQKAKLLVGSIKRYTSNASMCASSMGGGGEASSSNELSLCQNHFIPDKGPPGT
jgi:hypothetical protein